MARHRAVTLLLLALSGTAAVAAQESRPSRLSTDTVTSATTVPRFDHVAGMFDATVSADVAAADPRS